MSHKIILDTDIGSDVDDALALLYALKSPEIDLRAVTTVYGPTNLRATIAKKIIGERNIPVYAGESTPLSGRKIWTTGREGEGLSLGNLPVRRDAVEFLVDEISSHPGEYDVVAIGPMTNIAKALKLKPDLAGKINHLYLMGGAVSYPYEMRFPTPYLTENPEHNIYCDVVSAKEVFASPVRKTIVPLDVTARTKISRAAFEHLKSKGEREKTVANLVDVWFDYRTKHFGRTVPFTCMHDPLTLSIVHAPELVKTQKHPVSIDDAGLLKLRGHEANLAVDIREAQFKDLFLKTIYS
jgi:purine nucleosidase